MSSASGQSCRSELYSCNEWNGASNDSRLDRSLTVTLHQAGCQCDHHASCSTSASTNWMLTHVYARTYAHIHIHTLH